MPYDSVKARELLRSAPGFQTSPHADYIMPLTELLGQAEAAISTQATEVRKAHAETAEVQRRLDAEVETSRKLRESTLGYTSMLDALKAIAKNPKGSARVAQQALFAAGITEETKTA